MSEELEKFEVINEQFSAIELQTRGEVDMQVSTAKRYPRSISSFLKNAKTMATLNEETASSCYYVLKIQGKDIKGPGVRLAEICSSSWGNLRCESRVISEDDRFVTAQATAWDMERNVLIRCEVKRRITDRNDRKYSDDMIARTSNAAASIAMRNAIFKVIPASYIDEIFKEAQRAAVGDVKTIESRRKKALEQFATLGVKESQIYQLLGKRSLEDINLEDITTLIGTYTAIKDGITTIEETFGGSIPEQLKSGKFGFGSKLPESKLPEVISANPGLPHLSPSPASILESIDSNDDSLKNNVQ